MVRCDDSTGLGSRISLARHLPGVLRQGRRGVPEDEARGHGCVQAGTKTLLEWRGQAIRGRAAGDKIVIRKLGPHIQRFTAPARAWTGVAPIVKTIDDISPLQAAPEHAIRVYRAMFSDQRLDYPEERGVDAAWKVVGLLGGYRQPNLYVELYNEIDREQIGSLIRFHKKAVPILHGQGLKVAGFSWGVGKPEASDWHLIRQAGFCGVDALAVHEYWGTQGFSGWNALRYRKVHEWLGGQHPPFLITECGRDKLEGGYGGWKADGVSSDQYLGELVAYDACLQADSYVLGGTVFTSGYYKPWQDFDTDELAERLAALTDTTPISTPPSFLLPADPVPAPAGLQVGEGFQRALSAYPAIRPLAGFSAEQYLTSQVDGEVHLSWLPLEQGLLVWHKRSNRTWILWDDGRAVSA